MSKVNWDAVGSVVNRIFGFGVGQTRIYVELIEVCFTACCVKVFLVNSGALTTAISSVVA